MILYLLIFLLVLYFVFSYFKREGFDTKNSEFKTYINENIPNEFYTKIYDNVIHTIPYEKEVIQIMYSYFVSNPTVLIVGSRTGHNVQMLSQLCEVTGIDNSKDMIKFSKEKYPNNQYIYSDYTDKTLFQKNKFTNIICPLFTIYRVDLDAFLNIMYEWMTHKGYLGIVYFEDGFHISQIKNLEPSIGFTMNYNYEIELHNNKIRETIITKDGNKRINILELNDISDLEDIAKINGFKKINKIEIPNMPNTYVLILQKI
jgi:hypothetical protein